MIGQVIKSIREFFYRKNFYEVIVPIFNTSLPLEPNIYAFKVGKYYLPTSPEATLKKAIAKGIGNCFAIGHTFRDLEGTSAIHKPEFLMLEWYRENADYEDIMEETRDLILSTHKAICKSTSCKERRDGINFHAKWEVLSMVDLFNKYTELSLEELCHCRLDRQSKGIPHKDGYQLVTRQVRDDILNRIRAKGYTTKNVTWEQIFNQIFLNEVEPHLSKDPFFLVDYPARISPLCAKCANKPYLAERFELYINGIEIANGNTENTDADEVLKSMKEEEKYRRLKGLICPPIDMEFINALKKMRGKSYAGIGLGIERLAMVIAGLAIPDRIAS